MALYATAPGAAMVEQVAGGWLWTLLSSGLTTGSVLRFGHEDAARCRISAPGSRDWLRAPV